MFIETPNKGSFLQENFPKQIDNSKGSACNVRWVVCSEHENKTGEFDEIFPLTICTAGRALGRHCVGK
jgi:hypothetical protein